MIFWGLYIIIAISGAFNYMMTKNWKYTDGFKDAMVLAGAAKILEDLIMMYLNNPAN